MRDERFLHHRVGQAGEIGQVALQNLRAEIALAADHGKRGVKQFNPEIRFGDEHVLKLVTAGLLTLSSRSFTKIPTCRYGVK